VGEPLAVVLADNPYVLADAVAAVVVDYEPLPVVATLEQAIAGTSGDQLLHPDLQTNAIPLMPMAEGTDEALDACPRRATLRLRNNRCAPVPMETNAYLADWAPDGLTVWMTTQAPHHVRNMLSQVFGLSHDQCRIIAIDVGGGFGAKTSWYPEHYLVPYLSRKLGRAVKLVEHRSENMLAMVHGRDQIQDVDVGFDDDGRVQMLRVLVHSNAGAYPDGNGFALPVLTNWMLTGCYDLPQVFGGAINYFTNQTPLGAYRGAGRPEAAFCIERVMDVVADETGVDPMEVRRRNIIAADNFPYDVKHAEAVFYDSGNYAALLDKIEEELDYSKLLEEQEARNADPEQTLMGIGISLWLEIAGYGPRGSLEGFGHLASWESARIRILPDGSAVISTGAAPHGQGTVTTFAQIASDVLGIDIDRISVVYGDTHHVPQGIGTMGSRAIAVGGSAVLESAQVVLERARAIAAHLLEASPDDIVLDNGGFAVTGSPGKTKTWSEVGMASYQGGSLPEGMKIGGLEELVHFEPSNFTYPAGAYGCVVGIDRETGRVTVERFVAVDDCGTVINPLLAHGQVMGGVAQGIAQALYEEVSYEPESGQPRTSTLADYLVPTAAEMPAFELWEVVTPTPANPLGAKGLGESGSVGTPPAVINAVVDGLSGFGVRDIAMPATPERVWTAMSGG
jgi:carbon-monoxide dehydrogenase large subunit